MVRGKVFQCEITVSPEVEEKLFRKHNVEIWEIEEAVYDDPNAYSVAYKDCHFIYGQTFSGRYLLVLVRILSPGEIFEMEFGRSTNVIKIITSRDMDKKQRKLYNQKKGLKK